MSMVDLPSADRRQLLRGAMLAVGGIAAGRVMGAGGIASAQNASIGVSPAGPQLLATSTVGSSALDGMGVHQALAVTPNGTWYSGSDVSFVYEWNDSLQMWQSHGRGHTDIAASKPESKTGALIATASGALVCMTGNGRGQIYYRAAPSSDWIKSSSDDLDSGSYYSTTEGSDEPRPWHHPATHDQFIWMGARRPSDDTYGLIRSSDDGKTFTRCLWFGEFNNRLVRAVQVDPLDGNVIWCAASSTRSSADPAGKELTGPGVFQVSSAQGGAQFKQVDTTGTGAPNFDDVYDLWVCKDPMDSANVHVYVVGRPAGIWLYQTKTKAWTKLPSGYLERFVNITGSVSGSSVRLAACAVTEGAVPKFSLTAPLWQERGTPQRCVVRSLNGGATWQAVTDGINLNPVLYGATDGEKFVQIGMHPEFKHQSNLAGTNYFPSQMIAHGNVLAISGKEGCYRSDSIWAADVNNVRFRPWMRGLGAAIEWDVAINPQNSSQLAAGDTDNSVWLFSDKGDTRPTTLLSKIDPDQRGASNAFDVHIHEGRVIAGRGHRDDNKLGDLVVITDAWGDPKVERGMLPTSDATDPEDTLGRVMAVTESGKFIPENWVQLALVQEHPDQAGQLTPPPGGIYYRSSTPPPVGASARSWTPWERVKPRLGDTGNKRKGTFLTRDGDNRVWLYVPAIGLFRDTNSKGRTWEDSPMFPLTTQSRWQGHAAQDKTNRNLLYVTAGRGLWRISNAHDGRLTAAGQPVAGSGSITAELKLGTLVTRPVTGPVAVDQGTGYVYVLLCPDNPDGPALMRSTDQGVTWETVAGLANEQLWTYCYGLAVGGGRAYLATDGAGLQVIGVPS